MSIEDKVAEKFLRFKEAKFTGGIYDEDSGYESFETRKSLTIGEVLKGQEALDRANKQSPDFEGWVHVSEREAPNSFLKEDDTKLKQIFKNARIDYWDGSIVVSEDDVKNVFEAETGKILRI